MIRSWITQGPLSVCETHLHHRVSPAPSKIPYGGFSPVRLQTGMSTPTFADPPALTAPKSVCPPLGGSRASLRGWLPDGPVQRPLARPPVMLSGGVIAYYALIRATHRLWPAYLLRPDRTCGREWVP